MKTDKIFRNTAGIGRIPEGVNISGKNAKHGDKIIVSGTIADHGVTILTQREELHFESNLKSDTAPLNHLVEEMTSASGQIHVLRDPTRGGLATTLNEIAQQSSVGILLVEDKIPVKSEVNSACELLGLDPLYIANEGKLIAFVAADHADKVLKIIRKNKYGKEAQIIGEITSEHPGKVLLKTSIGGTRIVDMLAGEQLPRIC
jgi:hydrogenase expression/formation protein HypE